MKYSSSKHSDANEKIHLLMNQSRQAMQQGRFDVAAPMLATVLKQLPRHAELHYLHGVCQWQMGALAQATQTWNTVTELQPDHLPTWLALGSLARQQGDLATAAQHFERSTVLQPAFAMAWVHLASVQIQTRQFEAAQHSLNKALALSPDNPQVHYYWGQWHMQTEQHRQAIACLDKALAQGPGLAAAWLARGACHAQLKQYDQARRDCQQALVIDPGCVDALSNLGLIHKIHGDHDAALDCFERALALQPHSHDVWLNKATLHSAWREHALCEQSLHKALDLNPQSAPAQWSLAVLHLRQGEWSQGWPLFESRLQLPRCKTQLAPEWPRWQGQSDVRGQTIVLIAEEGLGDTLQFCRFAKPLHDAGARTVLFGPKSLGPILRHVDFIDEFVDDSEPLPALDWVCPLMSLPWLLGTTVETVPLTDAYLQAPDHQRRQWQDRLAIDVTPNIGLVFSGNPDHVNDHQRSIAAAVLLQHLPAGNYHCLQQDVAARDRDALAHRGDVRLWDQHLKDFADTAALCEQMDLIISVDTSVAHLCGALGKPTWILLSHESDWRWLNDRSDSPWYRSVRLYRQANYGDWSAPLSAIQADLTAWMNT